PRRGVGGVRRAQRFHAQHDDLDFFGDVFLPQNVAPQQQFRDMLVQPLDGPVHVLKSEEVLGGQRTVEDFVQDREEVVFEQFRSQDQRIEIQKWGKTEALRPLRRKSKRSSQTYLRATHVGTMVEDL